jgi:hypothetical protein
MQEHGDYTPHPLPAPTWNLYGIKVVMETRSVEVPVSSLSVDT